MMQPIKSKKNNWDLFLQSGKLLKYKYKFFLKRHSNNTIIDPN